MTIDLAIIVPSRGRPGNLARLTQACQATCQLKILIAVGLDHDDPQLDAYEPVLASIPPPQLLRVSAGRLTMAAWTNKLASYLGGIPFLASLGDDHIPQTPGWDATLTGHIKNRFGGTGIAYGNDLIQGERLPTAPVISSDIVAALGWMCLPGLHHYYVDDVWRDLGNTGDCLAYDPDVIIRHAHYSTGQAPMDDTYTAALNGGASMSIDHATYTAWRETQMLDDAAKINRLKKRDAQ